MIGFQGGDIFLNCENIYLKRSFKMSFFSVSERHIWTVVGLNDSKRRY